MGLTSALLTILAAQQATPDTPSREPVASVRVAFDIDGETSVDVAGYADIAARREATADDPVRVASISKLVMAIGVLRLVEAERIDLDADISDALGWRLRNPAYPNRAISWRMLLSHQSSIRDDAGYVLPLDARVSEALDDPRAWDRAHAPGGFFAYANMNSIVVATALENITGTRFDLLMDRLVLAPLDIAACYNWTNCDDATAARAIVLYEGGKTVRDDHRGGGRPACAVTRARDRSCDLSTWRPGVNGAIFSPQGGLRISARGLATIGRLLLGDGAVDDVRLLTPKSVALLARPLWRFDGGNGDTGGDTSTGDGDPGFYCAYGLGVTFLATAQAGCRDDLFGDDRAWMGHGGDAYGLRSGLWIDRKAGRGVAYFATGVDLRWKGRRSAFTLAEERLAQGNRK